MKLFYFAQYSLLQVLPFLHSRSYETRAAASAALLHIFNLVPLWHPFHDGDLDSDLSSSSTSLPLPEFPTLSVKELMQKGSLLLASSGKEFTKPPGILANSSEVSKARKEAIRRLGLEFLDTEDINFVKLENEVDTDVQMEDATEAASSAVSPISPTNDMGPKLKEPSPPPRSTSGTPAASSPSTSAVPPPPTEDDLTGLSARERNRLKRKRKQGNSAFVAAPPPPSHPGARVQATPAGLSNK